MNRGNKILLIDVINKLVNLCHLQLASTLLELAQVVCPLVDEAQSLCASVSENIHTLTTYQNATALGKKVEQ